MEKWWDSSVGTCGEEWDSSIGTYGEEWDSRIGRCELFLLC